MLLTRPWGWTSPTVGTLPLLNLVHGPLQTAPKLDLLLGRPPPHPLSTGVAAGKDLILLPLHLNRCLIALEGPGVSLVGW